jgi:hypothetical protein
MIVLFYKITCILNTYDVQAVVKFEKFDFMSKKYTSLKSEFFKLNFGFEILLRK